MKTRMMFGSILMSLVLFFPANANEKNDIQKYFNDAAQNVRITEDASEKRSIINTSLQNMTEALDMVQQYSSLSKNDVAGIERLKTSLREKQDELIGTNGFERVADSQLNAFAGYIVQDMEQADQMISISLVTLLLILILVVLIV